MKFTLWEYIYTKKHGLCQIISNAPNHTICGIKTSKSEFHAVNIESVKPATKSILILNGIYS